MERVKNYLKPLAYAVGGSAMAYFFYLFYKRYLNNRLALLWEDGKPKPLNKNEAMLRSTLIENVNYNLYYQFKEHKIYDMNKTYEGSALITFDLTKIDDIFLDFVGKINKFVVNSTKVPIIHKNGRIYIDRQFLKKQNNVVVVTFTNTFNTDSSGFCYYSDPVDMKTYIYTNLEPAFAHTVFPCFDQPNLKATFKLYVSCPGEWVVISSTKEERKYIQEKDMLLKEEELKAKFEIGKIRKENYLVEFKLTGEMPTYTFSICAGNFVEHSDEFYDANDKLPRITIYCRESFVNFSESFPIFKTAKQVFLWFRENLTSLLPFDKLDFVFLPNLKPCAMENMGCITFNDEFLEPTQTGNSVTYFHSIIAHEIAHTWFGNIVTPEWWDDLWLNESFATFLSYLSLAQLAQNKPDDMEEFDNVWQLFHKKKTKAIIYDQYKTTHKVTQVVEDTHEAEIAFDKITYYKGAAILKYFYYVTGHELFFKGLKNYVHKFKNKNANYEQFKEILNSLSEVRDIKSPLSVIQPFLDNVGITRLQPEFTVLNNQIQEFKIYQHQCPNATSDKYYNHKMNILFVYEGEEKLFSEVEISDSYESVINGFEKLAIPSAVVLNAGDWAYFKQTFDNSSKLYLIKNTHIIKDAVTRLVVARDLSEMVKDGTFDVASYIEFTANLIKHEKETHVIEQLLRTSIHLVTHFILFEKQNNEKEKLFNIIKNENLFYKHKSIRKTIINFMIDLIDFTHSKEIKHLITLLSSDKQEGAINLERGYSETLNSAGDILSFDLSYMDLDTKFRLLETIRESIFLTKEEKTHFEELVDSIDLITSRNASRNNSMTSLQKEDSMYLNTNSILKGETLEKMTIEACTPDKSYKEKLWYLIVNKSNKSYSDDQYAAIMRGFARKSQYPILKEYFEERFFQDFPQVIAYHGEKYALMFFNYIAPNFIIREDILKNLVRVGRYIRYQDSKLKLAFEKSKYLI